MKARHDVVFKQKKLKKSKKKFLTFLPPRGTPTPAPYRGLGATYKKSPRWPHDLAKYECPCQISSLYDDPFGL